MSFPNIYKAMGRKFARKIMPGDQRWLFACLALMGGELPYRCLKLLSSSPSSAYRTARRMLEVGLLREERGRLSTESLRSLKPTEKLYEYDLFPGSREMFEGARQFSSARAGAGGSARRKRSLRAAEALAALCGAGAAVIPGTKPDLSSWVPTKTSTYYTSREMRTQISYDQQQAFSGRAVGYVIPPSGRAMQVFSLTARNIVVRDGMELETLSIGQSLLDRVSAGRVRLYDMLILASSTHMINTLVTEEPPTVEENTRRERLRINPMRYENAYYFPKTREGVQHLRMFLEHGPDELKAWALGVPTQDSSFYDATMEEYGYVLTLIDGNIQKLKRFLAAAKSMPEDRFTLGCVAYQRPAIEELIKGIPNIRLTPDIDLATAQQELIRAHV